MRWIKNLIGGFLNYGGCYICGDSWWWKKYHMLNYSAAYGMFPYCEECHLTKSTKVKQAAAQTLIFRWEEGGAPDKNEMSWRDLRKSVWKIIENES